MLLDGMFTFIRGDNMSGNYPYINNYTDDLELPKGWEDVSYHNDALPSWMTSSNQQVGYHVWIDSWDIEERKNNAKHIYFLICINVIYQKIYCLNKFRLMGSSYIE